jgi:nitrogen fixation protein FixH
MSCCGVFIMPVELSEDAPAARAAASRGSAGFEFQGWHALALFIGFFAVIGSVNAIMMTLAIRTMPGLDARNGYDPSQRFNAELRLAEERAVIGLRADADVRVANGEASLVVSLRTKDGMPAEALSAVATLRHPSDRKRDQRIALTQIGNGTYGGKAAGITPGAWDLIIEARPGTGGEIAFASRQRIELKG